MAHWDIPAPRPDLQRRNWVTGSSICAIAKSSRVTGQCRETLTRFLDPDSRVVKRCVLVDVSVSSSSSSSSRRLQKIRTNNCGRHLRQCTCPKFNVWTLDIRSFLEFTVAVIDYLYLPVSFAHIGCSHDV